MKIESLRFQNLNSLTGEWSIDFTDPAFADDGIFAITGPTGAGKSTLLDAICLALYGRTPRLDKVTQSENEILSRQTGTCFAEVVFSTPAGRYRAHWSQSRARAKPDGRLQQPKHEVSDAATGNVLESKLRDVARSIEEKTGMDFDRFTRSMLLAQGAFAAFLKASPDERAPILEQITGTEIYSRISIAVHARNRDALDQKKLLERDLQGITPLEEKEENKLLAEKVVLSLEVKPAEQRCAQAEEAVTWQKSILSLRNEIARKEEDGRRQQQEREAFRPEQERLENAEKAAVLEPEFATLKSHREQQEQDAQALEREQRTLPQLEQNQEQTAIAQKSAGERLLAAKENWTQAAPILKQVRSLDQTLATQSQNLKKEKLTYQEENAALQRATASHQDKLKELGKAEAQLQDVRAYQNAQAADQWLVANLAAVEDQLSSLTVLRQEITQKEQKLGREGTRLKQLRQHLTSAQVTKKKKEQAKTEHATKMQERTRDRDALLEGRLLREYRAEQKGMMEQRALIREIASLEEKREHLVDGQPCPLCGSEHHPYAEGNVPRLDKLQDQIDDLSKRIEAVETIEEELNQLKEVASRHEQELTTTENTVQQAENDVRNAEQTVTTGREELESSRSSWTEKQQRALNALQPLGITELAESETGNVLQDLKARKAKWESQETLRAELTPRISRLAAERDALRQQIDGLHKALAKRKLTLEELEQAQKTIHLQRVKLLGDKQADAEEQRLQNDVDQAERAKTQADERYVKALKEREKAQTQCEGLKKTLAERATNIELLQTAFAKSLRGQAFDDEAAFQQARLRPEERLRLQTMARSLKEKEIEWRTQLQDRQSQLKEKLALNLSPLSLEELEGQAREARQQRDTLRDGITKLALQLEQNAETRRRFKDQLNRIEVQKRECDRWGRLHELIGSADGKKFRNFAQGLTFERMVSHANRQLQKMSDRYLLKRNPTQPLDLDVIDNYQAGEVRSTRNLSGGESFIVSLALALGLSQMASDKVRVDSLFLDEGFGTLDEEALDTALGTLAGLQQEGKLIGVISHVATLKERIRTQITVIPATGGQSRLAGPGCSCP